MQLPPALRQAIERELEGIPLADLAQASEALSRRYRAELRDGRLHLDGSPAAKAYLATRMPATFAAIRDSLSRTAERLADFQPRTQLDVGAGPGTALWAACETWPGLAAATLIEASEPIRKAGERLAAGLSLAIDWRPARIEAGLPDCAPADLVTAGYLLDELDLGQRTALVRRLWELTSGLLVVVEPGTPAGWQRILAARAQLIALGAAILAPCPHAEACPLAAPDWCHFSARVARSRQHRQAKGGSVPWEDEKFIYLAASRLPAPPGAARILAPPQASKAAIDFKLCRSDGAAAVERVAKRDAARFKRARKLDWGDLADF